ncbi:uncharacterized protein A4U43_C09F12260 [Asparagus officinalis]|uniref:MYB-CC type transcription factor LHEQLE-containing domain-containing protein n=1 Tax=Asparagus officinalis TaxID=4686 RepID=A0A5P1EAD7_ASPOF|nr:uncharacterized protein A4U43_C09F12260 [Asparagus officinalis]
MKPDAILFFILSLDGSGGNGNDWQQPGEATPKTILRLMNIRGLTLYHLKSHLQKYRLGKQSCKELIDNSSDASGAAETQSAKPSAPPSSILIAEELNDGCNEAMRVQMELQRRLHEQLEVQRHIQVRIEAQDKYLQSILERACNILIDPDLVATEHESITHDIFELSTREIYGCANFQCESLKMPSLAEMTVACLPQITECSVDSCLTSTESPAKVSALKKRPHPLLGTN